MSRDEMIAHLLSGSARYLVEQHAGPRASVAEDLVLAANLIADHVFAERTSATASPSADVPFAGEQYSRDHAEFVFREMTRDPGFSVVPSFGAIFNARVSGIDLTDLERAVMIELRVGALTDVEMAKVCGVSQDQTVEALESLLLRGLARRLKHDCLPALWCEP